MRNYFAEYLSTKENIILVLEIVSYLMKDSFQWQDYRR